GSPVVRAVAVVREAAEVVVGRAVEAVVPADALEVQHRAIARIPVVVAVAAVVTVVAVTAVAVARIAVARRADVAVARCAAIALARPRWDRPTGSGLDRTAGSGLATAVAGAGSGTRRRPRRWGRAVAVPSRPRLGRRVAIELVRGRDVRGRACGV